VTYKGREVSISAEHSRNRRNIQFNFFKVNNKLFPLFHIPKVSADALPLNTTQHNDVIQIKHKYVHLACIKWCKSPKGMLRVVNHT
jgi:hypothetical protein